MKWLRGRNTNGGNKTAGAVGSDISDWLSGSDGSWGHSAAAVPVNTTTAMLHTVTMACVITISEDLGKIPINLMRRKSDGGKEIVREDPLAKLLRAPNKWQTRLEWMEMMLSSLLLRSNGYSVIIRDGRGKPVSLVPIHPDRVTLYEAPSGDWFYFVTRNGLHETAVLKDMPYLIHNEDMLHFKWMSTWNSLSGSSRISWMRESIGLSIGLEQQAARLAANGARPGGILEAPGSLSERAISRFRETWKSSHGGWRRAGETAILEEGLKWKPLAMSNVDAEFMASRQYQAEDIARGFRVPLSKLGLDVRKSSNATAYEAEAQAYVNDVLLSHGERIRLQLERSFDIDGTDRWVEWDWSHFNKADLKTRTDAGRAGVTGMLLTPNEWRESEGLPRVSGGDVIYQPANMFPIGTQPHKQSATGLGSDITGAPGPGGSGTPEEGTAIQ